MNTEVKSFFSRLVLPSGVKIPSTNTLYSIGRGGYHLYKNPDVSKFQDIVQSYCNTCPEFELLRSLKIVSILTMDVKCYLIDNFAKRDVTNLAKSLEDAICDGIGIDDSKTIEFRVKKVASGNTSEIIDLTICVEYCSD